MIKKTATLIIFLLIISSTLAQNNDSLKIDSLKVELKKVKNDTTKINILNEISSYNFYGNPMIGMGYSELALNLSTKIKWKKGMAVSHNHLGICNWVTKNFEKSISCFQKALVYYKELKDQDNIADNYNRLGTLYGEINQYDKALAHFNTAYNVNVKIDNNTQSANDLSGIANIYFKMGDYPKTLDYYSKAKNIYLKVFNLFGVGYTNINMGKTYVLQKKYAEALNCYNEALEYFTTLKIQYFIADVYLETGKAYFNSSFENKNKKTENLKLAIQNFNKAIQIFTEIKSFEKINDCNLQLSKSYKEIGNYELSLDYLEKHYQIKETVLTYENNVKLGELRTKREIEVKDKKIEIQKLQIKSDNRKMYLLVTITIAIAILLSLVLFLYAFKRKTNRMLLEKNEEILSVNKQKDKFFSIIAHDLRGPFNGFLGLSELLAEDIDEMEQEEIQFAAVNMRNSAKNLNTLLDNLLEWSSIEQGLITFSPKENDLNEIVKECLAPFRENAEKKEITFETKIDQNLKIFADHHILQSVIRNLVSNAVKFTPKKGKIKIKGHVDKRNTFVSITDTGIGMDAKMVENIFKIDVKSNRPGTENEPSTGLGLILVKEFIEKHKGEIWVESKENIGTTFHFSFPNAIAN